MRAFPWVSVRPMNRATTSTILTLSVATLSVISWAATPASAQQAGASAGGEGATSSPVVTITQKPPPSQEKWMQVDLEEARLRSKRTKNALIGTSVAFGVGAIIAGIGASQCQVLSSPNQYDELLCNNAGNVMLPLGGTIAGLSFVGMLTSGIMLGVANKRKRDIQRDIRRGYYGERRLQWDVRSSAVVF